MAINNYLRDLAVQIEDTGAPDSANYLIIANDGDPALVHIRDGATLTILKQNEDLSKLEEVTRVSL